MAISQERVAIATIVMLFVTLFVLVNARTLNLALFAQDYPELIVVLFFAIVGVIGWTTYKK